MIKCPECHFISEYSGKKCAVCGADIPITEKDIESTEHISLNQNLVDFNLSCLNAKGLSQLYDFYFDLIQDEENIK